MPAPGNWPVDPQTDVEISKDRIWVDGCFDFAHHGTPLPRFCSTTQGWDIDSYRPCRRHVTGEKARQRATDWNPFG